ncbi:hypothetical protein ACJJTC_018935 [Scirpophaga incertulas]
MKARLQFILGGPQGRRKRRGGRGRRTEVAAAPVTSDRPTSVAHTEQPNITATASAVTAAPPKSQRQRKPRRPQSTGAETPQPQQPSEGPVVAASRQRTKAKPATSDRAPTSTERTTADVIEQLIQLIKVISLEEDDGHNEVEALVSKINGMPTGDEIEPAQ